MGLYIESQLNHTLFFFPAAGPEDIVFAWKFNSYSHSCFIQLNVNPNILIGEIERNPLETELLSDILLSVTESSV